MLDEPHRLLRAMFDAAVGAASPGLRVPAHLPPPPRGRTVVVGAGKASAAMARAVELGGLPGVFALAGDTDGVDGAEEVAGAIVTPDTLARATGLRISARACLADNERPPAPILSMAANMGTARRLTLAWGVHSVQVPAISTLDEMSTYACGAALRKGFAAEGGTIIVAAGTPVGVSGTTSMLKVLSV